MSSAGQGLKLGPGRPCDSEDFHPFASPLVRSLNFCCPQCDNSSVVELAFASRPVTGPAPATPPNNAKAEKDIQNPRRCVGELLPETAIVTKTGVSGRRERDETRVRNTMAPSSCDVVGGENSNGRATEPLFKVKRKSKNGEALHLSLSDLSLLFRLHLSHAARELGISMSTLKKACRYVGLHRWPGRKVRGLESAMKALQRAIVRQGADSCSFEVASMRSEISELQQELNELCHGTLAQVIEKMHSRAVITTNVYKRLNSKRGWRSNKGNRPNLTSGLAPASAPSAGKNNTGSNRTAKAKKQPERKQKLAPCSDDPPGSVVVQAQNDSKDRTGNTMLTPKTEIGEAGTGDEKVAVEEEGVTPAERSAKRPKTEPLCPKCGKRILQSKLKLELF